jgi:hypothetical protein
MCDLDPLFLSLGLAAGFIIASAAAIAVAVVLNGGFFSAPGAPIPMATAAALATAAAIALITAQQRAFEFFNCSGAPEACQGQLTNLTEALEGIAAVLGAQALAALAVALVAWIPWAAQPAMWVIAAALAGQLALIPLITKFADDFLKCFDALGARQIPSPLIIAAGLIIVVVLPFIRAAKGRPPLSPP